MTDSRKWPQVSESREQASDVGGGLGQVYLFGATLTSFRTASSREVLFLSKKAVFDGAKPIRGGVPLVFPQVRQPEPRHSAHTSSLLLPTPLSQSKRDSCFVCVFRLLQFGQPDKSLPSHGFARTSTWSLADSSSDDDTVKVCRHRAGREGW